MKTFEKAYYVVQVHPAFHVCGVTDTLLKAQKIAIAVKKMTGVVGKVVSFSREHLEELDYARKTIKE